MSNAFYDSFTLIYRRSEGDCCEAEPLYWFAGQGSKFTPVPLHLYQTQYHIINDAYLFTSEVMLELFRTFLNHQLSDIFKSPITSSPSVRSPHYILRSIVPINTHTLSLLSPTIHCPPPRPHPHRQIPPGSKLVERSSSAVSSGGSKKRCNYTYTDTDTGHSHNKDTHLDTYAC